MKTTFKPMAFIEMFEFCTVKYEMDKDSGQILHERNLDVACPVSYGFITNTLHHDSDALDVFVIGFIKSVPKCLPVTIVGAFLCSDHGVQDDKIIAVHGEPSSTNSLKSKIDEIKLYLETYKPGFKVRKFVGKHFATNLVKKDLRRYADNLKCE